MDNYGTKNLPLMRGPSIEVLDTCNFLKKDLYQNHNDELEHHTGGRVVREHNETHHISIVNAEQHSPIATDCELIRAARYQYHSFLK